MSLLKFFLLEQCCFCVLENSTLWDPLVPTEYKKNKKPTNWKTNSKNKAANHETTDDLPTLKTAPQKDLR